MSLIRLNGESFAAKNIHFWSPVNVNCENLALKDYSFSDSPRYDCVLFVSLIKLNGQSIAAKNVLLMSLVKVIICVLFLSLIKVNGKHFAVKIDGLCFTLCFAKG